MMHEDAWAHVQCRDTCIPHAQRDHSMHDGCMRSEGVVSFRGLSPIYIYIYMPNMDHAMHVGTYWVYRCRYRWGTHTQPHKCIRQAQAQSSSTNIASIAGNCRLWHEHAIVSTCLGLISAAYPAHVGHDRS